MAVKFVVLSFARKMTQKEQRSQLWNPQRQSTNSPESHPLPSTVQGALLRGARGPDWWEGRHREAVGGPNRAHKGRARRF